MYEACAAMEDRARQLVPRNAHAELSLGSGVLDYVYIYIYRFYLLVYFYIY